MNRALAVLPLAAVLVAAAWPATRAESAPGLCEQMTPARLLESPGLARAWSEALRAGDSGEVARLQAMVDEIRTLHGCSGAGPLPSSPGAPRLPPGHPPIAPGERPGDRSTFEEPGSVTI